MRYVQVQFNPWDRRSYTYEHAGEEAIEAGDRVEVTTRAGDSIATVVGIGDVAPSFVCKPIKRVLPRDDAAAPADDAAHGGPAHSPPAGQPDNSAAAGGDTGADIDQRTPFEEQP